MCGYHGAQVSVRRQLVEVTISVLGLKLRSSSLEADVCTISLVQVQVSTSDKAPIIGRDTKHRLSVCSHAEGLTPGQGSARAGTTACSTVLPYLPAINSRLSHELFLYLMLLNKNIFIRVCMSSLATFTSQATELHLQLPTGETPLSLNQPPPSPFPHHVPAQHLTPSSPLDGIYCPHQQMSEHCDF